MSERNKNRQAAASAASEKLIPRSRCLLIIGGITLIVALCLIVYWPCLQGAFVLDDDLLVTENALVQSPNGLSRIWLSTEAVDYWPITNSVFWGEWHLWGANPTGYHAVNLTLHIIDVLLIWALLTRLQIPGAYLAAMLFAVHPVNVESVAWIAQLKNVLSLLFFLLSLLAYLQFDIRPTLDKNQNQPKPVSLDSNWGWYALSVLTFALAMLSKGSVAVLPILLLLIIWWRHKHVAKRDFILAAPFFLVALGLTLINIWFQSHGHADPIRSAGFIERLLGAAAIVWFYLGKALLPLNLSFVYPQWHIEPANFLWWLPLLAIIGITASLCWQRNSAQANWIRPLLFAWLFFCVALLPVMGFVNVTFMAHALVADHYQHIALIAVVAVVAAAATKLLAAFQGSIQLLVKVALAVLVIAFAALSWQQATLYATPIKLYRATLEENPDSWLAHNNLAIELAKSDQTEEAILQCQEALRVKPHYFKAHDNLGLIYTNQGRLPEAIEQLQQSIQSEPNNAIGRFLYGNALAMSHREDDAILQYQQAVRLKPDYFQAWNNLAAASAVTGRLREAVAAQEKSLELAQSLGKTAAIDQLQDRLAKYRATLKKSLDSTANPPDSGPPQR